MYAQQDLGFNTSTSKYIWNWGNLSLFKYCTLTEVAKSAMQLSNLGVIFVEAAFSRFVKF
jgi:hypothetical protein